MRMQKSTTLTSPKRFAERYPDLIDRIHAVAAENNLDLTQYVFRGATRWEDGQVVGSYLPADIDASYKDGVYTVREYDWIGFELNLDDNGNPTIIEVMMGTDGGWETPPTRH